MNWTMSRHWLSNIYLIEYSFDSVVVPCGDAAGRLLDRLDRNGPIHAVTCAWKGHRYLKINSDCCSFKVDSHVVCFLANSRECLNPVVDSELVLSMLRISLQHDWRQRLVCLSFGSFKSYLPKVSSTNRKPFPFRETWCFCGTWSSILDLLTICIYYKNEIFL